MTSTYDTARWGLPDPVMQAEFYADVPVKRAIAWVADIILIALLTALAIVFTAFIGVFFAGFIFLTIGFIYRTVSLATFSATLGMRLTAIELRNHRGERFGLGQAFFHVVGYYVSMAVFPVQVISIILMLTTPRGQGLTDMVLGSAAINRAARD